VWGRSDFKHYFPTGGTSRCSFFNSSNGALRFGWLLYPEASITVGGERDRNGRIGALFRAGADLTILGAGGSRSNGGAHRAVRCCAGVVMTPPGLGAARRLVVVHAGYSAAFVTLGVVAAIGAVVFSSPCRRLRPPVLLEPQKSGAEQPSGFRRNLLFAVMSSRRGSKSHTERSRFFSEHSRQADPDRRGMVQSGWLARPFGPS
jgi:hypothetical protein